jgi:hypothetical protein
MATAINKTNAEGVVVLYKVNGTTEVVGMIHTPPGKTPTLYRCEPYNMEDVARLINPQHNPNGDGLKEATV